MSTPVTPDVPVKGTKAIVGASIATAIAFLGALGTALTDNVITPLEWTIIGVATLTALGGTGYSVYRTVNAPKV